MATTETRMTWQRASDLAGMIVYYLRDGCERIEIAGSVRRKRRDVGDIEIVAIPKRIGLMEDSALDPILQGLVDKDKLRRIKNGEKMKQFDVVGAGCKLDLFLCEPETWGCIFTIRTGPATFSKLLVTQWPGGYCPKGLRFKDGRIWDGDNPEPLETPEEIDVFRVLQMKYVEPEART